MADKTFDVLIDVRSTSDGLASSVAGMQALGAEAQKINASATQYSSLLASINAEEATRLDALTQQAAIESQRQVIAQTRFDLLAADVAGEEARTRTLAAELEIRSATLGVMRTQALSAAELNALTEQEAVLLNSAAVQAEATAAAAAGGTVNMTALGRSAAVLTNQLASGSVSIRTLGSLFGQLLGPLSIAGLGAFELYRAIASASDAMLELDKNNAKMATDLNKAVGEWAQLAKSAQSFADEAKLADKIKLELDKMSVEMAQFRAKELGFWASFWNQITKIMSSPLTFGIGGTGAVDAARTAAATEAQNRLNDAVRAGNIELDKAKQSAADWAKAEADLPKGIADYTAKLADAQTKLNQLDAQRHAHPTDAATLQAYQQQLGVVNDLKGKLNQLGDEQDKANKANKSDLKDINELLRESSDLLRNIRDNQKLINDDPSLSVGDKQQQLHALFIQEQQEIAQQTALVSDKLREAYGSANQGEVERLSEKLHELQVESIELGYKISTTTPLGNFRADIANWVNSFGTASHQIAQTIEGSINAALEGTNQLLIDAAYGSDNWKQDLVGVEKQVINLFLTMLEHMAEQQAASLLHITTNTTAQVASGGAIAAAHAPAAAATSISSYGLAAIIGEAAAVAAIAAIIAALAGGFKEGGFTGVGDPSTPAGIVHKGEVVFESPVVSAIGLENLLNLRMAAKRGYQSGGFVGSAPGSGGNGVFGGSTKVEFLYFTDPEQLAAHIMKTDAAQIGVVNGVNSKFHLIRKAA